MFVCVRVTPNVCGSNSEVNKTDRYITVPYRCYRLRMCMSVCVRENARERERERERERKRDGEREREKKI